MGSVERESLPPQMRAMVQPVPKGCRGAACPAFAICQGRCAIKRAVRELERQIPVVQ